jgi:beta-aspartyl-dipeptidase (metallo-type)
MGMLGTDGVTRSLQGLYAKTKALEQEGVSAYMLTSYFAYPPMTMLDSVLEDIIFIDKVIGCKIAISDERGSFPTENELLKLWRERILNNKRKEVTAGELSSMFQQKVCIEER